MNRKTKQYKEKIKKKKSKRKFVKCAGCGKSFTKKEMYAHIDGLIEGLRV